MTAQRPTQRTAWCGAKGGVGITATALVAAATCRRDSDRVVLVDLTGDIGVVMGAEIAGAAGISDIIDQPFGTGDLERLLIDVDGCELLPRGKTDLDAVREDSWAAFWPYVNALGCDVVVDAGRADTAHRRLQTDELRRMLVTTRCYQAHCRAIDAAQDRSWDGAVLVDRGSVPTQDVVWGIDREFDAIMDINPELSRSIDRGDVLETGWRYGRPLVALLGIDAALTLGEAHEFSARRPLGR